MRIGILGSGLMGAKLGTIFARAGHEVVFSYARSEQKLRALARDAGARAGTPREAAEGAGAVLLAVHWSRVDDVLEHAGELAGKVCAAAFERGLLVETAGPDGETVKLMPPLTITDTELDQGLALLADAVRSVC